MCDVCAAYCFESCSDATGKGNATYTKRLVSFALGGRRYVRKKTAGISMCLVQAAAPPRGT